MKIAAPRRLVLFLFLLTFLLSLKKGQSGFTRGLYVSNLRIEQGLFKEYFYFDRKHVYCLTDTLTNTDSIKEIAIHDFDARGNYNVKKDSIWFSLDSFVVARSTWHTIAFGKKLSGYSRTFSKDYREYYKGIIKNQQVEFEVTGISLRDTSSRKIILSIVHHR